MICEYNGPRTDHGAGLLVCVHVRFQRETMSSLQQVVEIFVTCVDKDGPLLKLWGQLDRTQATRVERLILQLREQFERGLFIPSAVTVGQLCCARYNDGVYYRARVTSPADLSVGQVAVHFIDYGNSEVVSLSDIRSLEANSQSAMLASVSDQATDFFLAGVLSTAGAWDENSLAFIRQALCYEELKSVVVAQICNKRLIQVFYNNEDFAQILIASKIGVTIAIHAQQALIQAYSGSDSAMQLFPGFTVPPPSRMMLNHLQGQTLTMPPPPLPAIRMDCNSQQMLGNTPSLQERARFFTTPVLELNSEHVVSVPYVEDGPLSFAVQLQASQRTLSAIMDDLNKSPPVHITQPLMPGSVCLGRFTGDKALCRAVVVNVLDDKCKLYYVDFGNSEVVPYSEIFELPRQFFISEVMALHFALAGLKTLTVSEDIKSYFKELVTGKLLRLRVIPPEGPPIKQYGELHLNGTNVLDLLIQKMKEKQEPCNFPVMPIPKVGTTDSVKVSYVIYASKFYVQLEVNAEALKSVMLGVEDVCTRVAPLRADQLEVGLLCCAQYSEDRKWYRAKILSLSSSLVEVLYVDYGNTDSVSLSSVKPIDPSLVKILNTQAIPCCLFGFQENMNEYLAAKLEEMTLDKTLTMVVKDKLQNDTVLVELYDNTLGSHVNVGAQLLSNETAQESNRTQHQLPIYNSTTEDSGWQEGATEASSEMSQQGSQDERKKRVWGEGADRSSQRESSRSGENISEWRSRDRDGSGGGKPWQNKDHASWKDENGERGAKGKWGGHSDGGRSRSGKWNSRGDDERLGKSWSVGSESGRSGGDTKKKTFNRDEEGGSRYGGGRNTDEGGGHPRKWNNREDNGERTNRCHGDNDNFQRRGGIGDSSTKWRGNRAGDDNSGSRGGRKPWDNHEQSQKEYGIQNNQNESVQTANEEWDVDNTELAVPVSIPEAPVQIGDLKPVEVVFLTSPEEFCIQVTSESSKLTSVMEGIASSYGTGGGSSVPIANLKTGTACVARYSEDGNMYRGIIESVNSASALVLFCDYGNKEDVPLDEIKEISSEFMSLPIQGLRCRLLAAKPQSGGSWLEEEIIKFTNLTEGKELEAHIINKSNMVYEIVLKDLETGININEQFGARTEELQAAVLKAPEGQSCELVSPDQKYCVQIVAPATVEKVQVTWFINPEQFYCQMETSQLAINDMMNAIQAAYCSKPPLASSVQVGCPVIAKFLSDGVLYRAEVKEIPDTTSLVVQFVDYGNCDIVMRSDVWEMEARFMFLPKQALQCCLRGVTAVGSQWSGGDEGVDKYFKVETFSCTFHDCEQGKYNVSLMSEGGKSIADQLLEDGLAVAQVVHSETMKTADDGEMFLDLSLLPGQIIRAYVTLVGSDSKFYVRLSPALANRIQALVDEYVQKPEDMQPVGPDSLAVNSLCIASRDGAHWLRGEIADFSTGGTTIRFIDVGDSDEIPLDRVLVVPPALAKFHPQAVECHVASSMDLTIAPDMDVILRVESVDRARLFVTVFSVEGRKLNLLENIDAEPSFEVDPVCPLPVTSKQTKVWVSHVEGPDSIWLQRVCDASTIAELLEEMYIFYVAEGKGMDLEVTENKLCAAKSVSDGQWYRGRILAVNVTDATCTVLFIDYGNSETIPAADVRELDASLFTPHAQAVCTALAVEFVQSEQITSQLLELTADKECTAVFGLKKEDKWLVDLFVEGASISKKLLDSGLVKVLEAHFFKSELKAGTDNAAFVSHIESPCSFWIQRAEDSQEILTLQDELQAAADMLENMSSDPPIGTLCLGMYDEAWYRARVLEINSSLVTVRFIDYGNVEVIDISSEGLKPLPEKMQGLPEYAERCSLIGSNKAYMFHDGATEMMEALVGGTEELVTVRVFSDGEVKHVDLISTDKNSVLMTLVKEGLATDTQQSKQNSALDEDVREQIPSVSIQVTEEATTHVDIQVTEGRYTVDTETSDVSSVFVSHVTSPAEFWIQYESDTSYIEEMENRLLEAKNFPVVAAVVEGAVCAAEFTDGCWYRARVVQVTDGVDVLFFDYGNHSASAELRRLPEDLLTVPPLAKCCSLPLLKGVKEWSTAAQEKFIERVGGGNTQFQVKILEEGDTSVVSLLNGGQRMEEELINLCTGIDEVSTVNVQPCKLYACVSHVISPSEFWIQFEEPYSHLEEVASKLNESEGLPILNDINEGVLCVAQFPEGGDWYRARILSHNEDRVEVLYVDYGNTAISPELRQLPHELKDIPFLARKCSLSISNDTLEQTEIVNDAFKDIVDGTAKMFEIEVIKDGNPTLVSMWYEGQNVEEELIKVAERKKVELSAAGSETVMETCPNVKNECRVFNEQGAILEDGGVEQGKEVEKEYNIKHFEGVNELDTSGMQGREIGDKTPYENGQGKMEEKWKDSTENTSSFVEYSEESNKHQNGDKVIVDDIETTVHDVQISDIEGACCRDFTSQQVEESKPTLSAEFIDIDATKESTKDAALQSLNMCTVTETKAEQQKDELSGENVQNQSPELYLQRTQHTETLVREINIEIKTPEKVVSNTLADLHSERIVPASISRVLSREELLVAVPRSASPKLMHDEKIVPGCISQSKLADTDRRDGTKSAPSTPLVTRSSRILHRVLSCDEFWQRNVSSPKLTHNDRIVPGSITRGEAKEESCPLTPKLPHAEKIVPGSIGRGISDEGSDEAAVTEAHECDGEGAPEGNSLSVADIVDCTSIALLHP